MLYLEHNNKPPLTTRPKSVRGLVGHWTFQEGAGDLVHDRSGYNNLASLVGATWIYHPDRGRALDFDGSNDYVDVPARDRFDFDRSDVYSVTGWFKTSNTSTVFRTFVEKRTTSGVTPFEMMVNTSHKFQIGTWNGSVAKVVISAGTVNDGLWHFGVFVHTPDSGEAYLDGYSEGTFSGESGTTSNTEGIRIGADTSLSRYFPGQLDDIRIYNKALSAAEVWGLYTTTRLHRQWLPRRRVLFKEYVMAVNNDVIFIPKSGERGQIGVTTGVDVHGNKAMLRDYYVASGIDATYFGKLGDRNDDIRHYKGDATG